MAEISAVMEKQSYAIGTHCLGHTLLCCRLKLGFGIDGEVTLDNEELRSMDMVLRRMLPRQVQAIACWWAPTPIDAVGVNVSGFGQLLPEIVV
ncbi:hypothetical protein ACLOJK_020966 [Asimina triloba]